MNNGHDAELINVIIMAISERTIYDFHTVSSVYDRTGGIDNTLVVLEIAASHNAPPNFVIDIIEAKIQCAMHEKSQQEVKQWYETIGIHKN